MTLGLTLLNAALAAAALAAARLDRELQRRLLRGLATLGVAGGLVTVVGRGALGSWRTTVTDPGAAAVAGTAIACAWGLTIALEIDRDRWWISGLTGVASASLLLFAGAAWIVPALLFWGCLSAALTVAVARDGGRAWLWIALADAGMVAGLVTAGIAEESWRFPEALDAILLVPLAIAALARTAALAGAGGMDILGTRCGPLTPLMIGSGFLLAIRVLERPLPAVGALVLVAAIAVAVPILRRRSFSIRAGASWPTAVGLGLCVAVPSASTTASVGALLGVSAFVVWPEALDRGRLSRAALMSMIMPNVMFGAVATVASDAFVTATMAEGWVERAPWTAVSALLPFVLAVGVALGIAAARTERKGSYLPEAVFMSWLLFAASIGAAAFLGAGGVYEALGGSPAAALVALGISAGGLAAWRSSPGAAPQMEPLADVVLGGPRRAPRLTRMGALAAQATAGMAVAWFTVQGLRLGFL